MCLLCLRLLKKIAACQLTVYLETNKLLPEGQSGFRRGHSTETLLLHLLSDIYGAVDSSQLTLLPLFDVSEASDTVNHEILLKRLEISFGLSGNFLSWVGSFLSESSICVHGPSRSACPLWSSSGLWSSSLHHLHLRDRPSSHCHFCVGSYVCLPTLS